MPRRIGSALGALLCLWGTAVLAREMDVLSGRDRLTTHCYETASLNVSTAGNAWRMQASVGEVCPAFTLHVPVEMRDLSGHRFVEFTVTNSGPSTVEFTLWALSPGGWSGAGVYPVNTNGRVILKPGMGCVMPVDLWARFPGPDTFSGVVDPSNIDRLRIVMQRNQTDAGSQLDLYSIRITGDAPVEPAISSKRVRVPEITDQLPAAGRRVWRKLPKYESTALQHVMSLPDNWKPGVQFPIIVEYTGNEFYYKFCHSTGLAEQGTMAGGLARGKDFICLNLPFVSPDGEREQPSGWGDKARTIDYCLAALKDVFDHFGGDPSAVILTGFSRGQIAMNCIGLYDDLIADVWLAFVGANPGQQWLGGKGWNNSHVGWDERAARMKNRPWFDEHPQFGAGVHVDVEYLEDCDATVNTRNWLNDIVKRRPGLHDVRGRATDVTGRGIPRVRIESGPTRFAYTDAAGQYVIRSVVDGRRAVTAFQNGANFNPSVQFVTVQGADATQVNFTANQN